MMELRANAVFVIPHADEKPICYSETFVGLEQSVSMKTYDDTCHTQQARQSLTLGTMTSRSR